MNIRQQFRIRPAAQADFRAIISLWKESVLATHSFLRYADFCALEKEMGQIYLPSVAELWLCPCKGGLAGFCGNNGAHVEMLFINPGQMRKGIGRSLLEHVRRLHGPLALDVNEDNKGAFAFYLRCGFRVMGHSPCDNQGRPYPLLHLVQKSFS